MLSLADPVVTSLVMIADTGPSSTDVPVPCR